MFFVLLHRQLKTDGKSFIFAVRCNVMLNLSNILYCYLLCKKNEYFSLKKEKKNKTWMFCNSACLTRCPFLEGPETFSRPESRMITELF